MKVRGQTGNDSSASHEIEIVRCPKHPSDTLGYALLGRHGLTPDEAERVLKENFVRIPRDKLRPGDRYILREHSAKEGVQGKILDSGWVKDIKEGKLPQVSSMWRTNAAILEYTLGTRKFPKDTKYNIEFYHRNTKILDDFKQIGGKSELSDAKLIWLLENHLDEIHHKKIMDLIVSIAKSDRGKNGIIVLMDSIQSGEEIDKRKYLDLRINAQSRMFENQKEMADTLWKASLPFALLDNVRIFGCDDLKLTDDSKKHASNLSKIEHEIKKYEPSENWEKVSALDSKSKLEREKLRKLGVQRNTTWLNRESRKAGIPAHLNQDLSTNLISDGMVHGLPVKYS